ncbi:ferrochelatase, mitochondrial [Coccinella septempunctata]|uniref:ferrochelatase, mitochondrial n=1 Tax=Coccinella septempunctata TaxID=41139 RepID=UPI001D07983D|nr:ferrochelatase, mitochondrial [Coccinella septempunctata]
MFISRTILNSKPTAIAIINNSIRNASNKTKTGIVMMNMGGPQKIEQVYDYLHNIMTDRDMIQLPFAQDYMGKWIAKRRTPEVQKKYSEIGGGSPILDWTNKQGELLCKKLGEILPNHGPYKHYVAFRYVNPFTKDAFEEMKRDGIEHAVLFSQYPQYSCATSGSSYNAIYNYLKNNEAMKDLKISVIDRWSSHPLLVKCFADLIKEELHKVSEKNRKDTIILFSAHSLPLKAVNRGDPYPSEVGTTVNLVMNELKYCNPYQLVWQSKVGPLPWLGPFTDEAIEGYVKQGKKSFVIVPIAFVNEHIETLHELDIEYCQELAEKVGVEEVRRVPAPNVQPIFISALADIVKHHFENKVPVTKKFLNQCPHCVNSNCYNSKKWFKSVASF